MVVDYDTLWTVLQHWPVTTNKNQQNIVPSGEAAITETFGLIHARVKLQMADVCHNYPYVTTMINLWLRCVPPSELQHSTWTSFALNKIMACGSHRNGTAGRSLLTHLVVFDGGELVVFDNLRFAQADELVAGQTCSRWRKLQSHHLMEKYGEVVPCRGRIAALNKDTDHRTETLKVTPHSTVSKFAIVFYDHSHMPHHFFDEDGRAGF